MVAQAVIVVGVFELGSPEGKLGSPVGKLGLASVPLPLVGSPGGAPVGRPGMLGDRVGMMPSVV
jgi:hypothetical protein